MSYIPESKAAQELVHVVRLISPGVGTGTDGSVMRWIADMHNPRYDWDLLREVLLGITCPVPCVGHRRAGVDWHEECEARADAAVAIVQSLGMPIWPAPEFEPEG